jgi:hypothetical protein
MDHSPNNTRRFIDAFIKTPSFSRANFSIQHSIPLTRAVSKAMGIDFTAWPSDLESPNLNIIPLHVFPSNRDDTNNAVIMRD